MKFSDFSKKIFSGKTQKTQEKFNLENFWEKKKKKKKIRLFSVSR